jgi:hypothetical protein
MHRRLCTVRRWHKMLVSCRCRIWFGGNKLRWMGMIGWHQSVAMSGGYGCWGEGGGSGRFVSWLGGKIQPPKEGVRKIVMVERWDGWWRKKMKWCAWSVEGVQCSASCLLPPCFRLDVDFEKAYDISA